jgi:LemA protein
VTELWVVIAIAIVLLVTVIAIYNGIISRANAAERAWANVITQERQKNKIIPHLEDVVKDYKAFEQSTLTQVTELRSALQGLDANKIDTAQLEKTEARTGQLLKSLNITVENYPELKASESYQKLMKEITDQQDNIGAAIRIFNQNVEDFNNGIETFPNSWVNGLLNKKVKIKTFSDSEAQEGFDYKPNF